MSTRGDGPTLVGRGAISAAIWTHLESGVPVVVTGPAGAGRTAVMREALAGRRVCLGGALATASFRPYLALERAFGAVAPKAPDDVGRWILERCGERVLAIDDLHLAHPSTVQAIRDVCGALPVVVTVATGTPGGSRTLAELASWGAVAPLVVHLDPLTDDEAAAVVRDISPDLDAESVASRVAGSGGLPGYLVADRDLLGAETVGALDIEARTALVAGALIARPCDRALLGRGVDALAAAGLARIDEVGEVTVVAPAARVALERTTADDRRALHAVLAEQLPAGEAARHYDAAGQLVEAAAAARQAAAAADTALERAGHLHFAARCDGTAESAIEAATALLSVGDAHTVLSLADALLKGGADGCLLLARGARLAGNVTVAADAVRAGLRVAAQATPVWRRLLVEAVWTAPPDSVGLAAAVARRSAAGTAEQALADVAVALSPTLSPREPVEELEALDLAALEIPDRFHAGILRSRALLRSGRSSAAALAAEAVVVLAEAEQAGTWAEVARVEAEWARYLHDGAVPEVGSERDGEVVRRRGAAAQRAAALLHLVSVDRDPTAPAFGGTDADSGDDALWHAIASEVLFAVGDIDEAAVHAALAGLPAPDPVVALLSGPVAITVASGWGLPVPDVEAFGPLVAELDRARPADDVWADSMVRGVVRGLLASGDRGRAGELATSAGLTRWADRCGVARESAGSTSADRDPGLTPRERQVLALVGAGCTTPIIARRLGIAASTVESHVKSARTKLGVRSRAGAVGRLA